LWWLVSSEMTYNVSTLSVASQESSVTLLWWWFVGELQNVSKDEPVSLLVHTATVQQFEESAERQTKAGIVSWSPPLPNWNPWTSCNIDEGPLATVIHLFPSCLHTAFWSDRIVVLCMSAILCCQLVYLRCVRNCVLCTGSTPGLLNLVCVKCQMAPQCVARLREITDQSQVSKQVWAESLNNIQKATSLLPFPPYTLWSVHRTAG